MTKKNLLQHLLDERAGAERDGWQRLEQRLARTPRRVRLVLAPLAVAAGLLAVWWAPQSKPVPKAGRAPLHIYLAREDEPALEVTLRVEP